MPTVKVYNTGGEQVGEMSLRDDLFAGPVNTTAMFNVAVMQLANRRQGTASTKTRSEVRGGGRKPWRQKGTGRARHGSIRSPIWVGGGVTFGPRLRSYKRTVPKKIKRLALKSALSAKNRKGNLVIVDSWYMECPKTKFVADALNNLQVTGKALLVTAAPDNMLIRSARNIPGVNTMQASQLNVLDVLNVDYLVFTRDAVARAEEVFT